MRSHSTDLGMALNLKFFVDPVTKWIHPATQLGARCSMQSALQLSLHPWRNASLDSWVSSKVQAYPVKENSLTLKFTRLLVETKLVELLIVI